MICKVNLARSKARQGMLTRLAESPGRPLERHGNVSPREMTVYEASASGQNPAYRPAHSPINEEAHQFCVIASVQNDAITQN